MLQIEFKETGPVTTLSFRTRVNENQDWIGRAGISIPTHAAAPILAEMLELGVEVVRDALPLGKPILDGDPRVKAKKP